MYDWIDWIVALLRMATKDPDKAAKQFEESSSAIGDRLRPWLYGLIGATVLLLLMGWGMLYLANG